MSKIWCLYKEIENLVEEIRYIRVGLSQGMECRLGQRVLDLEVRVFMFVIVLLLTYCVMWGKFFCLCGDRFGFVFYDYVDYICDIF